jgi:hypothetical protein
MMSTFLGNIMTSEEKQFLQEKMIEERDRLDTAIVPYLNKINSYNFIQTTYSCMGHYDKDTDSYSEGYIHFRSGLREKETINWIIKPMLGKFPNTLEAGLALYQSNLKYKIYFYNGSSEVSLNYLIDLLSDIIPNNDYGW